MSSSNPLKQYFRQPSLYTKLPTNGRWYTENDLVWSADHEVAVFGLTALDEVLLNTPDAMLNGQALEKVIKNCVPGVQNVKKLTIPDLESIFVAIKVATNKGKYEFDRVCPKCKHENNFEVNCQHLLDTMSLVEDSDTIVNFDGTLIVHIKPYDLEKRQQFLMKEFEEQRMLKLIDESNKDLNEFEKSNILQEAIDKMARLTFSLVSQSITKIVLVKEKQEVTDPEHIAEWMFNISMNQADAIIKAVNALNEIGVHKKTDAVCESCGHTWEETLNFDPVNFFGKR